MERQTKIKFPNYFIFNVLIQCTTFLSTIFQDIINKATPIKYICIKKYEIELLRKLKGFKKRFLHPKFRVD